MTPKSPLSSRLEQHHSRRDRYIEAPDRPEHRNRDQTVAVLPDQSSQPRAFGAEDDGGRERQVAGVVQFWRFSRQPDGPHPSALQAPRALAQCSRQLRSARAQAPPPMLSRRRRRARRNGAPGEPLRERLPHPPCGEWPRRCAGLRSRRARRGEAAPSRRWRPDPRPSSRAPPRPPPRCPDALRRARSATTFPHRPAPPARPALAPAQSPARSDGRRVLPHGGAARGPREGLRALG